MKKKTICYDNLSNEDLIQLYKADKDFTAREELIIRNIPLIKTLANKRISFSNMSYEDLVQEGIIGLIYGIEKYDPSFGTKFSTYVFYWILEVIDRAIYNKGSIIRFPMHMIEKMNKINKLEKENSTELTYTEEDICSKIGITLNEYHLIKYYLNYYKNISSLNKLVNDASVENDTPLLDFVSENNSIYEETEIFSDTSTVEDEVLKKALKKEISSILKTLTPREEKILRLRYGLDDDTPRTLEEIGKIFNLTRERIRQIESKALRKLRHPRRANHLKEYI
jgi:RNA polymerase primary sigma factor